MQRPTKAEPITFKVLALEPTQKLVLGKFLGEYTKFKVICPDETLNYTFEKVTYSFRISCKVIITHHPDDQEQPMYVVVDNKSFAEGGCGDVFHSLGILTPQPDGSVELDRSKTWVVKQEKFHKKKLDQAHQRIEQEYFYLRETYIQSFYPVFEGCDSYLIMECLPGLNLREYISRFKDTITDTLALKITINILQAINDLHSRNIVHRDIKPHNLIINLTTYKITIIDFGQAARNGEESTRRTGTPGYRPAELINPNNEVRTVIFANDVFPASRTVAQTAGFLGNLITKSINISHEKEIELASIDSKYVQPSTTTPIKLGLFEITTQMGRALPAERKSIRSALVEAKEFKLKNKQVEVDKDKLAGHKAGAAILEELNAIALQEFDDIVPVKFLTPAQRLAKYKTLIIDRCRTLANPVAINAFLGVINFKAAKNKSIAEIELFFAELEDCISTNYFLKAKQEFLEKFKDLGIKSTRKVTIVEEFNNRIFKKTNELNIEIKKGHAPRLLNDFVKDNAENRQFLETVALEFRSIRKADIAYFLRQELVPSINELKANLFNILKEQVASKNLFFNISIYNEAKSIVKHLEGLSDLSKKSKQELTSIQSDLEKYTKDYSALLQRHIQSKKQLLSYSKVIFRNHRKSIKRLRNISFFNDTNSQTLNQKVADASDILDDYKEIDPPRCIIKLSKLEKEINEDLLAIKIENRIQIKERYPEYKEIFNLIDQEEPHKGEDFGLDLLRYKLKMAIETYIQKYCPTTSFRIFNKRAASRDRISKLKHILLMLNGSTISVKALLQEIEVFKNGLDHDSKLAKYINESVGYLKDQIFIPSI